MPNQLSAIVEQRIVAFCARPSGARARGGRGAAGAAGVGRAARLSPTASTRRCVRHGLNTRAQRLALVAGYRAPYEPPRDPEPEPHIETNRPGELVGLDCFFVGRLHGAKARSGRSPRSTPTPATPGPSSSPPPSGPTVEHTTALARRVAAELQAAAGSSNASSPTTAPSSAATSSTHACPTGVEHTQIRSGRPQTNGHVERLHRTILEECWRPASRATSKSASPACAATSRATSTTTTTTANTTDKHGRAMPGRPRLRCPQDGAEMSRTCRHNSESVQLAAP